MCTGSVTIITGAEVAEILAPAFLPCVIPQFSQPFLLLCLAPVLICSHNVSSSLFTGPCGLWIPFLEHRRALRTFEGQLVHKHRPEMEKENQCLLVLEAALNMGCSCWSSTFSHFFYNLWLFFSLCPQNNLKCVVCAAVKNCVNPWIAPGSRNVQPLLWFCYWTHKHRNTLVNYKMSQSYVSHCQSDWELLSFYCKIKKLPKVQYRSSQKKQ